jgi:hypothetical protein
LSKNFGNQSPQQSNGWQASQTPYQTPNQAPYQAPYQTPNQAPYQAPMNNYPVYQKPFNSHLAMSIVAIFFFTILGIIATVMSNQANSAYRVGDFAQAESKANTAKILSIISYVVGSLFIIGRLCALAAYY